MIPGPEARRERAGPARLDRGLGDGARARPSAKPSVDPTASSPWASRASSTASSRWTRTGPPIRPAKLWNDTSTVAETEAILAAPGRAGGVHREARASALAVGFTASKILWLKRHEPDAITPGWPTVLLPHNYLNYRLTGERQHGIRRRLRARASWTSGRELERGGRWRPSTRPWPASSRPSAIPREPVGLHRRRPSPRSSASGKVLVSSGGGDNMMGAIGTGNVAPGVCTLSLGTSGTIYSYFAGPFFDPRGRDRRLLRQHGRLAAPPLHDERDQHDRARQVAASDSTTRGLEAAGRRGAGRGGRAPLPALHRRRARPRPARRPAASSSA